MSVLAPRHIGYGNAVAAVGQRGYDPYYCPTAKTPILYSHGATLDSTSLFLAGTCHEQVVLATGSPMYGVDTGDTWANATGRARPWSMKTWVQNSANQRPAKSGKAILWGESMGAQNNFAAALDHPELTAGIVAHIAIPDVSRIVADGVNFPGVQASAWAAHTNEAGWLADAPTSDIGLYAESLAGIPILWIYSTNDPFYTPTEVLSVAARIGSSCTTVSQGAVAHTVTSTPTAVVRQIIAFVLACQQ